MSAINTKSILLADDEEPSRRFLTYYLSELGIHGHYRR